MKCQYDCGNDAKEENNGICDDCADQIMERICGNCGMEYVGICGNCGEDDETPLNLETIQDSALKTVRFLAKGVNIPCDENCPICAVENIFNERRD